MIHHVIAMLAALPGLEDGGGVQVRNPQIMEVPYDVSRGVESEALVELDAVGGKRKSNHALKQCPGASARNPGRGISLRIPKRNPGIPLRNSLAQDVRR